MELDEDARNFCRLVLLLLKVGKPKIRQFFIDQWNAVKGHQRWTDCGKNGQDLLRLFANPLAHELEVIKSGNTLKWSLPLVIKVLLHLEKPLIIKKSRIKALNYLGELREEVGRNHKTVIKQPEFEKKWDDACTALTLFGATSRDFKETKKDMKQYWDHFYPFLKDVASHEKGILELLPTLQQYLIIQQSAELPRYKDIRPQSAELPGSEVIIQQSAELPRSKAIIREQSAKWLRSRDFGHPFSFSDDIRESEEFYPQSQGDPRRIPRAQSAFEEPPKRPKAIIREQSAKWPRSRDIGDPFSLSDNIREAEEFYPQSQGIPAGDPHRIRPQGAFEEPPKRPKVLLPYRESGNEYVFRVVADSFHSFDGSKHGIFLEVPPYTVSTLSSLHSHILCSLVSDEFFISPVGANETLVSYIVDFDSSSFEMNRKRPVIVTLSHSGADESLGYETVVKTFDKYQMPCRWRDRKEYRPRRTNPYVGKNGVQVRVNIPTTLAVVTRPITDRFQVTPRGCVVRSSVCDDVTIEFPEGAVKKTVEGTMKLMLMPESIHHAKDACSILCVDGFSNITFSKPVIVKMPIPNNAAEYSKNEIRILRLEDNTWEENEWRDVTHQAHISKSKTHIEFHFTHFSCLWPWMSGAKIKFASTIFRYLRSPPRAVCFAAFKDNEEASLLPKLTLVCVANHKQWETVSNMRGEGCSKLAVATGERKMRPNDKAYLRVNGADMKIERFFLRFLKEEVYRKELSVQDRGQDQANLEEVVLNFFPNLEENFHLLLGTLRMSKDMVFLHRGGGERQRNPVNYQLEVEEEAQPLEGACAVANPPLLSSEDEEEEVGAVANPLLLSEDEEGEEGIQDLVSRFDEASLATLSAGAVAERLPQYLGVDRTLIPDPPYEIIQKCQRFCRFLKNNGRRDIVEALRDELPSGMTGPLLDGNGLVKDLDHATKLRLSRALSVKEEWQIFAEKIDGITNIDIQYYSARKDNPVLEILKDYCKNMKIDTLYRLLVESGANAYADFL